MLYLHASFSDDRIITLIELNLLAFQSIKQENVISHGVTPLVVFQTLETLNVK